MSKIIKIIYLIIAAPLVFGFASISFAYVSSSANYRVQYDSINAGGGETGSISYNNQDSLGGAGSGDSFSLSYKARAGYQELGPSYLFITAYPASISLDTINGYTGGQSTAPGTWTIKTDDPRGYSMKVKSASSPAMMSGANNFPNYRDGLPTPSFAWAVASNTSAFGFTPEGSKIIQKFKDNGSSCDTGSSDTQDACWYYFSITDQEIVNSNNYTSPTGDDTIIKFRYEAGANAMQASGDYSAAIVITVLAN